MVVLQLHLLEGDDYRDRQRRLEARSDLDSVAIADGEEPARGDNDLRAGSGHVELTADPVARHRKLFAIGQVDCEMVPEDAEERPLDRRNHGLAALLISNVWCRCASDWLIS